MPILKNESAEKKADLLDIYHNSHACPQYFVGAFGIHYINNMVCKLLLSVNNKKIIILDSHYQERPTNELPKMRI